MPNIVIADDYEDNRELLRLILEPAGYRISEARDGRECVARVRAELPDLVMIDLLMPEMSGWQVLSELRSDARTSKIPCVAITAFAAASDEESARAAGFDDYLSKPYNAKDLLNIVARLLNVSKEESGEAQTG